MPKILDFRMDSDTGGFTVEGGIAEVNYETIYVVEGDSLDDDYRYIIEQTPGLPKIGTIDRSAYLQDMQAEIIDITALLWEVRCTWTSSIDADTIDNLDQGGQNRFIPKHQQAPRYSWSTETWSRSLLRQQCDTATKTELTNPAGQPYDISTEVPVGVMQVQRYDIAFDPSLIWTYVNHVNETEWFGFPPRTVMCTGLVSDEEVHQDVNDPFNVFPYVYQKTVYTFKIRSNPGIVTAELGWDEEVPVIGTQYLDGTGVIRRCVDPDGNPVERYLNDDGTLRSYALGPRWKWICRYPRAEFGDLNLEPPDPDENGSSSLSLMKLWQNIKDFRAMHGAP